MSFFFFAEFGDDPRARGEILLFESIDWKRSPTKGTDKTSKCGKYQFSVIMLLLACL